MLVKEPRFELITSTAQFDEKQAIRNIEAHDHPTLNRSIVPARMTITEEQINPRNFQRVNPEYRWLFAFLDEVEFSLAGHKPTLQNILNSNAIVLLLENAYRWGNEKDPHLPIEFTLYIGRKGNLLRLKDQGKGFDVNSVSSKYNHHDFGDASESENTGDGLRFLQQSEFEIIYEGRGNIVYLIEWFES
jgi:hypothetical protein